MIARHVGEQLTIHTPAGDFKFTVVGVVSRQVVQIGIDAPREWAIERDDIKSKAPATDASAS